MQFCQRFSDQRVFGQVFGQEGLPLLECGVVCPEFRYSRRTIPVQNDCFDVVRGLLGDRERLHLEIIRHTFNILGLRMLDKGSLC